MRPSLVITLLLVPLAAAALADSPPAGEALARRLINAQGCRACHLIEAEGGLLGPDLKGLGKRLDAAAVRRFLDNPQHRHGNSPIGDFHHLSAGELDALVDFLVRRP